MQASTQQKFSRFVSNLKPLFPGYMFVRIESDSAPWRKVNSTIGVSRLLTVNGAPKPIPMQLISSLMLRCDEAGKLLPTRTLNKGDKIKISNGPFANFIANIDAVDAKQRIWILMEFMGQKTKARISPSQCQLIS